MRFTDYLIEAPQQGDWIRKADKANKQRARRAIQAKGATNAANAAAAQPANAPAQRPKVKRAADGSWIDTQTGQAVKQEAGSTDMPQRPAGNGSDTVDFKTGKPVPNADTGLEQKKPGEMGTVNPGDPQAVIPMAVRKAAAGDRNTAVELMTLLGSMYQAKRTNPAVQFSVPAMVTQSKNKEAMQALFDVAKTQDLPSLAKMSQDIKQVAAAPGQNAGAAPAGSQNVPTTPGQTAGQKTMLQKMVDWIRQSAKTLSPQDLKVVKKELNNASKGAKANPMQAAHQQAGNRPVASQG